MKITAFSTSNSSTSINLELIKTITQNLPGHDIEYLNLNDFEMPIYSEERNKNGIPQQALDFNKHLASSDAIIVGLAEHNGTFTTAFKNIFDWGSRADRNLFADKPMLLVSTSPGARGGVSVMENALKIFPYFGAQITSSFTLPSFGTNHKNGMITEPNYQKQLKLALEQFKSKLAR